MIHDKGFLIISILLAGSNPIAFSQDIVEAKSKPEDTEVWEPEPQVVTPGDYFSSTSPSDAIILFDGSDLSPWQKPQFRGKSGSMDQPADWIVENGEIIVKRGTGAIETKQAFGNIQLHVEWMTPKAEGKEGQGYSNSGIFLMTFYEIQVLNSYENRTYSNGQAGSIYKQSMPLVNASRNPGTWQVYDIIWTAPVFKEDGSLQSPAKITAFHNGILIQNNYELTGPTVYNGTPKYIKHPAQLPIRLQDHGNPVRYRNIWVREIYRPDN